MNLLRRIVFRAKQLMSLAFVVGLSMRPALAEGVSAGQAMPVSQPFTRLMVRKSQDNKYYVRPFGEPVDKDYGEFPAEIFNGNSGHNELLGEIETIELKATIMLAEPATDATQVKARIFLQSKEIATYNYYEVELPLVSNISSVITEQVPTSDPSQKKQGWFRHWLNRRMLKEEKRSGHAEDVANSLDSSPLYKNAADIATSKGFKALRWNITEFRIDLAKQTFSHFFDHQVPQWSPDKVVMQTFADNDRSNFGIVLVAFKDSTIQSAVFLDSSNFGKPGENSEKPKYSAYLYHDIKHCTGPCVTTSVACLFSALAVLPIGHVPGATAAFLNCMLHDTKCRGCAMEAMIQSIVDYGSGASIEDNKPQNGSGH